MCPWYEISSTRGTLLGMKLIDNQLTSIDKAQSEELDRGGPLLSTNKPRLRPSP